MLISRRFKDQKPSSINTRIRATRRLFTGGMRMKAVNAVKLRIVMNCMTQPPFYYHKEHTNRFSRAIESCRYLDALISQRREILKKEGKI